MSDTTNSPARKALTFVLNDPPYESARSTTALRLIDAAVRKGLDVNVFAYEGAVGLAFAKQTAHPNAVHGNDLAAEDHPTTKEWVAALLAEAERSGSKVEWVNCGLCVDERGLSETIPGTRRGGPPDLHDFVQRSVTTLVIPTR